MLLSASTKVKEINQEIRESLKKIDEIVEDVRLVVDNLKEITDDVKWFTNKARKIASFGKSSKKTTEKKHDEF